ncbi:hypothetical protein [Falsiroseomonas oryziterrae]|uniref:hypothetical protein n=1 Tax=Falsiroseomonas oryziterrae TaxID=2911368 RepID=UPI001F428455|nr:hypothetical protein [Roseomonas sp. NPKOSM-4]
MTAITNFALAPLALLFRISHANPILAILISGAAGGIAFLTGHDNWMAALVSFAAYLLIWLDESELRASEAAEARED